MTFAADIDAFIEKMNKRALAVFHDAAQELAEQIQLPGPSKSGAGRGGYMRVDTGFLRNSMTASLSDMPSVNPLSRPPEGAPANSYGENIGQVNLVIASARLDDTVYIGFTAAYAGYREVKDGFIRMPVQIWQSTVYQSTLKAMKAFP